MKLVGFEGLPLRKTPEGLFYFTVSNKSVFVNVNLVKETKYKTDWFKPAIVLYTIDELQEVDVARTKDDNMLLIPYNKDNIRVTDAEYIVFYYTQIPLRSSKQIDTSEALILSSGISIEDEEVYECLYLAKENTVIKTSEALYGKQIHLKVIEGELVEFEPDEELKKLVRCKEVI